MQDELLRNELLAEVDSIAPILAEHAPLSERLGRLDAPSVEAVRSTRQAAGGGALFDANPLQRCFRDVLAARQHFIVSQTSYQALGQFKLNQSDANPML